MTAREGSCTYLQGMTERDPQAFVNPAAAGIDEHRFAGLRPPLRLSDLAQEILNRRPTRRQLFLGIGDLIVQVKTNSDALAEELRGYFREFVCWESNEDILIHVVDGMEIDPPLPFGDQAPPPGKQRAAKEFIDLSDGRIVRNRLTGIHFLFNGRLNLACGPCLAHCRQIVNFINSRFIDRMLRQGGLLARASGVCHGDRGLALAGVPGSGKASLALRVLTRGASFVSNDRLMIAERCGLLRMYGVPKQPRVKPDALLSLQPLNGQEPAGGRTRYVLGKMGEPGKRKRKSDLMIDEMFGPMRFQLSAGFGGLLLLHWEKGGAPLEIRPVAIGERPDLLAAFIKSPGLFFLPAGEAPDAAFSAPRYRAWLDRLPVFEATGRVDFDAAADFCADFLRL